MSDSKKPLRDELEEIRAQSRAMAPEQARRLQEKFESPAGMNEMAKLMGLDKYVPSVFTTDSSNGRLPGSPESPACDHGVTFDAEAARGLSAAEVQKRWPRGFGPCPKGCGYSGISYASHEHYIAGDW